MVPAGREPAGSGRPVGDDIGSASVAADGSGPGGWSAWPDWRGTKGAGMQPDTGNTAWVLASAALVLFMTPGLAFFYGGMVRSKNVLGMLMQNFFAMGLVSVLWAVFVFSIAFGGTGKFLGDLNLVGLKTLGNVKSVIPSYKGDFALAVPALALCD